MAQFNKDPSIVYGVLSISGGGHSEYILVTFAE